MRELQRNRIFFSGLRLLPLLLIAGLLSGCSRFAAPPSASKVVETNTNPDVFTMKDPGQFHLATVSSQKVSDEIHVNGVIAPDVNRSVPVVSLGGGRVVDIMAKLGDSVRKGQVLLWINSPDLTTAYSDYQKFKADELLAEKQLARARLLYDKGAIALAEVEAAEDSASKAKVDLEGAMQQVHVLGGDVNHPSALLPLRAPISGVIVDQQITGGTGIRSLDNQQALFTIADLSVVWVLCDVYQDMLLRVHEGDSAEIAVPGLEGHPLEGKVVNISAVLDPTTRSAKVRIQLPNPQGVMRPGMFVTANFRSRALVDRAVIPASAVVRLHDQDWVYVPAGGSQFRRVAVELAPQTDGMQPVISGIKPGDQVVSNALQFSSAAEE